MPPDLDQRSGHWNLPVLDGFRGLAAYIVVVSHATNATDLAGGLLGRGAGQIGVMLFFVLSGFLMGLLYLGKQFDRASVWRFVVRRVARVVPLYYIVLTAALIAAGVSSWIGRDFTLYAVEPSDLVYHYGFIHGASVFWTIPVELQFYLAFIGVWWLYSKSQMIFWLCLAAATVWFFLGNTHLMGTPILLDYIVYFLAGLFLSQIFRKFRPGRLWSAGFIGAAAITFLLFPGVSAAVFGKSLSADPALMWQSPLYLAAATALLLTSVLAPAARQLMANRFMIFSGRISYSMYLLHVPVIVLLSRFTAAGQRPFLFLAMTLLSTIAVATASFYWIESPLRALTSKAANFPRAEDAREHALVS